MNNPPPPPASLEIPVVLTVAHTGFGGNTRRGEYFYSFSPDLILVGKGQQDVRIRYRLDDDVPAHFRIRALLSSDAKGQIEKVEIEDDGRSVSFVNRNSQRTLMFFTVVVRDTRRGIDFGCDPQVGNDPEIEPLPASA